MKVAALSRSRKTKVNLRSQIFSLSHAKTYLGRFILQPVPEIEPIPTRPAGYFANAYSRAEIQEDNRLAKASAVRAPKDLE